jgi:hypothetical protein
MLQFIIESLNTHCLEVISEFKNITTCLSRGLVLPLIYFTNPLPSSIVKELEYVQIDQINNPDLVGQIGSNITTNLSKGIIAYEAQV